MTKDPHSTHHLGRAAGLIGAAVGLAAAGTAVGVAVTRSAGTRPTTACARP